MDRSIAFLGGIPGTGKTTLSEAVARATGCVHVKASQLIREGRSVLAERPEVRDRSDADLNQRFLIAGLERLYAVDGRPILIDGHFVVPTNEGMYAVPPVVFEALRPSSVALLELDPGICATRLRARDILPAWWDGTVDSLELLQREERACFERVRRVLGVQPVDPTIEGLARALTAAFQL
jgi:adenylate kinase